MSYNDREKGKLNINECNLIWWFRQPEDPWCKDGLVHLFCRLAIFCCRISGNKTKHILKVFQARKHLTWGNFYWKWFLKFFPKTFDYILWKNQFADNFRKIKPTLNDSGFFRKVVKKHLFFLRLKEAKWLYKVLTFRVPSISGQLLLQWEFSNSRFWSTVATTITAAD